MKKVLLLNVWHDDNVGDSAIAQVCVEAAMSKWPGARIEVRTMLSEKDPAYGSWSRHLRSQFPDVDFLPALYPEPLSGGRYRRTSVIMGIFLAVYLGLGINLGLRCRVRNQIRGAEAVILVGGSDLFELRRPVTSRFRLRRITEAALDAVHVGVPVLLWGHTLGPFRTSAGKEIARGLFSLAEQILVRDAKSAEVVRELSPHTNVVVAPDFGFAITPTLSPARGPQRVLGRYVAIVPRRHFFDDHGQRTDRLLDELAQFAAGLLKRDEVDSVVLVPQVTGPSVLEDDRLVVSELASKICDDRVVTIDGSEFGPSEYCGLYSMATAVVAVRLHGAILAMAGGTPAMAVAYFTGKTSGVMEGLGFSDSWVEFDQCTAGFLEAWWARISSGGRSAEIQMAVDEARAALASTIGLAGRGQAT